MNNPKSVSSVTDIGDRINEIMVGFNVPGLNHSEVVFIIKVLYILSEAHITWDVMRQIVNIAEAETKAQ